MLPASHGRLTAAGWSEQRTEALTRSTQQVALIRKPLAFQQHDHLDVAGVGAHVERYQLDRPERLVPRRRGRLDVALVLGLVATLCRARRRDEVQDVPHDALRAAAHIHHPLQLRAVQQSKQQVPVHACMHAQHAGRTRASVVGRHTDHGARWCPVCGLAAACVDACVRAQLERYRAAVRPGAFSAPVDHTKRLGSRQFRGRERRGTGALPQGTRVRFGVRNSDTRYSTAAVHQVFRDDSRHTSAAVQNSLSHFKSPDGSGSGDVLLAPRHTNARVHV